ncbi:MAG: hypothetical protein SFV18_18015 [Bryobacteraceae bacterium]|nr:hypothetical protein [Bryobacteraceae bacterium]
MTLTVFRWLPNWLDQDDRQIKARQRENANGLYERGSAAFDLRALACEKSVSIPAFCSKEAATGAERHAVAQGLKDYFAAIDARTLPGEDLDEVIEEAIRTVRPSYRER